MKIFCARLFPHLLLFRIEIRNMELVDKDRISTETGTTATIRATARTADVVMAIANRIDPVPDFQTVPAQAGTEEMVVPELKAGS